MPSLLQFLQLLFLFVVLKGNGVFSFTSSNTLHHCRISSTREVQICTQINSNKAIATLYSMKNDNAQSAREEAMDLMEKAKKIRESLTDIEPISTSDDNSKTALKTIEQIEEGDNDFLATYRLYVDIGREPGTWMDPRWGMSGTRIEFTIDMAFLSKISSNEDKNKMVKDNFGGKSSEVRDMKCLSEKGARLRRGFDSMKCSGGAYRYDMDKKSTVVRFFIDVDGIGEELNSSYGDISIPKGCLYFSIPCFGNNVKSISMKEGPVTVRQIGWHTGWRREESRIVGTFKAIPLDKAKAKDGF